MCYGGEGLSSGQADIAHVADIKDANPGAHRIVFGDDSARRGIFDRHIPSVEVDHFRAHLTMDSIQRGFADNWRSRLNSGQKDLDQKQWPGW